MHRMVASFEAEPSKMPRKPYFELRLEQQRERLALVQRVVMAILQDPELSFQRDANGVVSLVRGGMDNAGEVMAAAANVNGYAVDVLRRARAMQLSMRQTLRLPCRCTRDELYEARRAITPYDAVAVSVRGHGGKKRAAAAVFLADLVIVPVSKCALYKNKGCSAPQGARTRSPCWYARTPSRCGGPLLPGAMCLWGFGLVARPVRGTRTIG